MSGARKQKQGSAHIVPVSDSTTNELRPAAGKAVEVRSAATDALITTHSLPCGTRQPPPRSFFMNWQDERIRIAIAPLSRALEAG
jgi:hypothetical protein